jgi:SPP1 family predicted phage head-tail adaptor
MPAPSIDPGRFGTAFVLEEPVLNSDGSGGHTVSWNATAMLFGRIEPLRATAEWHAGRPHSRLTHRITIRCNKTVASGMRLRLADRIFAIRTVHDPDETGRYLELSTEEEGR